MPIPFSPPDIREEDIAAVADVLRSGWITTGPVGAEFAQALTPISGCDDIVLTSSATTALETILRILGIGEGDDVLVPAYTYSASAAAALHTGARVILVDNAEGSYTPSPEQFLAAITPRTKAIITVDLGGVPYDRAALRAALTTIDHHPNNPLQEALGRIAIINDAAHSLGARHHNTPTGATADFTAFSFHAVKNLTTAEGGALGWHLDNTATIDIARQARLHTLHGQSKDALEKTTAGSWEYDIAFPGHKANMPDVLAALGLSQLRRYDDTIARRHDIIRAYDTALAPHGIGSLNHFGAHTHSSGHLYLATLPQEHSSRRNDIITTLAQQGIATNVHYKPLPLLTAYKNLGFTIDNFPHAHAAYQREITLPLHTLLSDEDVHTVHTALVKAL